jgi:hypothetical protein
VFWFSLQLLSETFLRLRSTDRDMIKSLYWSSYKVPVIFVRFYWNLNFLNRFSKNAQKSNVMKIRPVGSEVFHAEGRTDRQTDKQNWQSCQFLFPVLLTCLKNKGHDPLVQQCYIRCPPGCFMRPAATFVNNCICTYVLRTIKIALQFTSVGVPPLVSFTLWLREPVHISECGPWPKMLDTPALAEHVQ